MRLGAYHHDAVELAYAVDLLIHEARFADGEVSDGEVSGAAVQSGAAVGYAVGLAERCRAGRLVLLSHPSDRWRAEAGSPAGAKPTMPMSMARAGDRFQLGAAPTTPKSGI